MPIWQSHAIHRYQPLAHLPCPRYPALALHSRTHKDNKLAFDVVITNGTIVDGTGAAPVKSDIGIEGDRITTLGDLSSADSARTIDATGLTVTPGWIDTHAHSDGALLNDPQHANGLRQGITTEILDQDGLSYAPLSHEDYLNYRRYLAGLLGEPPEDLDMSTIAAFRSHYDGVGINTVCLVPHGPLRISSVGFVDAPIRGAELEKAKALLSQGLEEGARGLATGMSYYPNAYSDTEELIELCKVVAEYGGVYVTHLRDHETDRGFGGGGVTEALEIGRQSGVKVHFSHYRTQADSAGKVDELMAEIDAAKADGVDVTLECYPYPVGSSFPMSYFSGDFHEGGADGVLARLADPVQRAKYITMLENYSVKALSENSWSVMGPESHKHLEGMYFRDVAAERGVSVPEMICDVILETKLSCGSRGAPPHSARLWRQVEADVMSLLSRDDYMIGSDAIPIGEVCHPRAFGCFPRVVGRLRRRLGYPIEQVVQRLTQNPANRFGLTDRGVLAEGKFADIVVFDADRIIDQSSFEDPRVHPAGIPYVIVNGKIAVDHEEVTGVLAGKPIP